MSAYFSKKLLLNTIYSEKGGVTLVTPPFCFSNTQVRALISQPLFLVSCHESIEKERGLFSMI
ncbi:hypothetical protein D3I44_05115 [Enterococcus faecium]|nr:hypothetical protein [Enterococcus faecium]